MPSDDIQVSRSEFEELRDTVETLRRRVENQQEQIATLKRRTTTDAGGSSSSSDDETTVPRNPLELHIIRVLRRKDADVNRVSVDSIKQEAAEEGFLRSRANIVISNWLDEGYLAGDQDGKITVSEWPNEQQSI